jgi:hypothetical protein
MNDHARDSQKNPPIYQFPLRVTGILKKEGSLTHFVSLGSVIYTLVKACKDPQAGSRCRE